MSAIECPKCGNVQLQDIGDPDECVLYCDQCGLDIDPADAQLAHWCSARTDAQMDAWEDEYH